MIRLVRYLKPYTLLILLAIGLLFVGMLALGVIIISRWLEPRIGSARLLLAFLESLTSPSALDLSHTIPASVPSGLPVGGNIKNIESASAVP